MMSVALKVDKHAQGYPNNVLAQRYGEHMFHILLDTDTDNGNLVAVGDWNGLDVFKEKAVTEFEGEIVEQMSNGNWLVLVKNPGDACLVYEEPISPYESPSIARSEKAMYNEAGSIVRCYGLTKFDRFEVSAEGFEGTPAKKATITSVSNKKMVIA